ncbi:hypothetical protein LTR78_002365 [Recurvomyces mirabilis]|uniref:CENP-V/GFA domain-containing protein n=1 Tax=Recurvomyces mirabilis TaxID=574656 RepID=A0AAE0WSY1_9PEZI|nr:hypothetical protein LTR78_002365 [Recurvomyces mirabilis]KAK5157294.1 hypothetical protein LTS14_004059 [Recurvomyces mirabilis]
MPDKSVTKTATCLCGSVSFTTTGIDKGTVICHCSNCQRYSGSPFMHNTRLVNSETTFQKGQDVIKKYEDRDTKNGNLLERWFCSNCGSPMMFKSPTGSAGFIGLQSGTLQEREKPFRELYGENKHAWLGDLVGKAKL